ncbi:MAG: hypothetical protein D6713_05105 [Deltaproteobacteria bacterium]|nr:MAG: hypothetical protein D6713_05105 [Deltaproteobacteria bacterium]
MRRHLVKRSRFSVKWFILSVTLLFFLVPRVGAGRVVDGIFLTVNGEGITFSEFREFVAGRLGISVGDADSYLRKIDSEEKLRPLLDDFINVTLVRVKLKELGESVSDEEVERVIDGIVRENNITREQFRKALEREGLTYEGYRERLREDMEKSRLVRALRGKEVLVTDDEVREYYVSNRDRFLVGYEATFDLLSVNLSQARDRVGPAALREVLARLEDAARKGEHVSSLAEMLKERGIQPEVSSMGPVAEGDLRGELKEAVGELRPGETSSSIVLGENLVFISLREKKGGRPLPFDEVKEKIREELVGKRSLAAVREIIKDLREKALIRVNL